MNEDFMTAKEARELKRLLARFMKEYGRKPAAQSDEAWLKDRFLAELPGLSEEDAEAMSRETVASIAEYDRHLASAKEARAQGKTAQEWFADQAQLAASGMSAAEYAARLNELDNVLEQANTQMMRVITTQDGAVSQQTNLDGFMAEQQHVNAFNVAAELQNSGCRAEVCTPGPGETYGKNSFDVVIRDAGGRIAHQYQFKYGKNADATIAMIRRGNYNNQTLVVPPEQVEAVQAAFPGKTVVSQIGGTEKVPVSSAPISKADMKELQKQAQERGTVQEMNWGSCDPRMLAKYVGSRTVLAGVQGAVLATGFHLASKAIADEPIDTEEVVTVALETGADTGIKAATAGALKAASEKQLIGVLPPGTPMGQLTKIACMAIENVKILKKAAVGEITAGEALDQMGCTTASMYYGLSFGAAGAAVGATALSWIPIAGPIVGGVVGGTVGYMAGSKVGEKVYQAAKTVATAAKKTVVKAWEGAKSVGRSLKSGLKRGLKAIFG